MSKALSVALIGVGGYGATHLKALHQLENEGRLRLSCVADAFGTGLEDVKRSLIAKGGRWYQNYHDLLDSEDSLDAVAIATPIHLHREMTMAALARGLFVYLEKPPVPLIQQLDELIALDVHRKVMVGFQLINWGPVQQLKRWRTEGALGELQSIRVYGCTPRLSRYYSRAAWAGKMIHEGEPVFDGPATNAISHWLHNVMYLSGHRMEVFDSPVEIEAEVYRARPIESYDILCMRGTLGSGATFNYAVAHATEKSVPCRLEMIGSKGRAWIVENCSTAENDMGLSDSVSAGANPTTETWRRFLEFVDRKQPVNCTLLGDTRGYVLATNASLLSSRGIHQIDPTYLRIYGTEADKGYELIGLPEMMRRSVEEGRLFSEMNAGWSRPGKKVSAGNLRQLSFNDYLPQA